MRPVEKQAWPLDDMGNRKVYSPYGTAKNDLIGNIGGYCSFCERRGYASALDVEHVQPKDLPQYTSLIEDWNNFLLGCKNCNPIKGTKDVRLEEVVLPHLNNTFLAFEILEGGAIAVNPSLPGPTQQKVNALIDLVGLDREPGHPRYSHKDKRWEERFKAYNLAMRYLDKYETGAADTETIVDLASQNGFWSVWMTVFAGQQAVRRALINGFPGTCNTCFDTQCIPLNRNGAEI